jgi:hypothetical protein
MTPPTAAAAGPARAIPPIETDGWNVLLVKVRSRTLLSGAR